jgi:hypothetical protein
MNTGKHEEVKSTYLERKRATRRSAKPERKASETHKFCRRLNDIRKPIEHAVAMCGATNGQLLTDKDQVLTRWKEQH